MAEEFDPKNIDNIRDSADESRRVIDEMYDSIKRFNNQVTSGARIGNTLLNSFKNISVESDAINKKAAKLATTKDASAKLMKKALDLGAKQRSLEKESGEMASKAVTSHGLIRQQYERQAENLANMAREAGRVKDNYSALAKEAIKLDGSTKFFTGASKFVNSIPGLKAFAGPFDEAAESSRQALMDGATSLEAMEIGIVKFEQAVAKMAAAFLIKSLFTADQQITNIGKNTEASYWSAYAFRQEMSLVAISSNDLRINSETLLKANQALNDELGLAVQYDAERLIPLAKILDAQVLTTAQAAKYNQLANNSGQTVKETLKGSEAAVNAVNNELGTRVSLKGVMEATATTSGQIKAQLGGSSEAISRAVVTAKALGFELEQVAAAGKQMLDFESSISAELEAELLTGKQLNLEKARMAALTGDYETLTKEINANVGSFAEYSNMNVLQQDAIAKAVGMTSDSLSEALLKQGDMKAMMAEAVATGDTQTIQQLEQLSTQEKFAKAVEGVKNMFIDVMAVLSPLLYVIDLMAEGMNTVVGKGIAFIGVIMLMVRAAQALKVVQAASAIFSIFQGNAKFGPVGIGLSLAAIALMAGAVSKYAKMDDGVIGKDGGMVVNSPKGSIQLNKDDSIIAGTNLGGKNNSTPPPPPPPPAPMTPIVIKSVTQFDSFGANNPMAPNGRYQSLSNHESKFA